MTAAIRIPQPRPVQVAVKEHVREQDRHRLHIIRRLADKKRAGA